MARLLIPDDGEDLLLSQRMYLESRGYSVTTAATGNEAIELIKQNRPDIVLADLMMEHYDSGFVFCKRAREQEGMKTVPIIMQTASLKKTGMTFDRATRDERRWMNVDEVLTKPVPFAHLQGKIEQYLAKSSPGIT